MSETPEITVMVDGQQQTVVSASYSEGPDSWKGHNFPYGDSRVSTKPFDGARQIQMAFDEADVSFLWFGSAPPKSVEVSIGDRQYSRLVDLKVHAGPSTALIAEAKVARR